MGQLQHRKNRVDAQRGKMWSKLSKAIIVAARLGGSDPAVNLRLRKAVDDAKALSMPKDNLDRAIKKGTGELEGENVEEVVYKGYGPGGGAVMVDLRRPRPADPRRHGGDWNRARGEFRQRLSRPSDPSPPYRGLQAVPGTARQSYSPASKIRISPSASAICSSLISSFKSSRFSRACPSPCAAARLDHL